jgi:hypothetical protein
MVDCVVASQSNSPSSCIKLTTKSYSRMEHLWHNKDKEWRLFAHRNTTDIVQNIFIKQNFQICPMYTFVAWWIDIRPARWLISWFLIYSMALWSSRKIGLLYNGFLFFSILFFFCLHLFTFNSCKSLSTSSSVSSWALKIFFYLLAHFQNFLSHLRLIHSNHIPQTLQPSPFHICYQVRGFIQFPQF